MAIDNLTGTTWYVPSGWTATRSYGRFAVIGTFISEVYGNVSTEFIEINIGYNVFFDEEPTLNPSPNTVTFTNAVGFPVYPVTNTSPFTVTFTSLTDVNQTSLIQWLTDNDAVQLKVTDLTDTTWTVNAGWEAEAGYGVFSINGYHSLSSNMSFDTIMLGYSDVDFPEANTYFDSPAKMLLLSPAEILITITSGDDVTNPKLIAWLSKYGELQEEEEPDTPEEPTVTSQGEIYYKGELVATLVEGETIVLHTKDFKFLGDIVIKNVGEV